MTQHLHYKQLLRDELAEARFALERETSTASELKGALDAAMERIVALEGLQADGAVLAELLASKV
jgi:hypothetical protein